ncbi:MAG: TetR/AcrR family transcriptional regulator [Clostridiales bacterium]|nr:TetR/AcrR family transcriptional regulator [Clostridiales bacterium]
MNTKGSNRSVRRTQDVLKKGLVELLLEKPIQQITVKELTEYVNINRGTFYLYYDDIYDLLEQIEEEMHDASRRIVEAHADDFNNKSAFSFLKEYYEFLKDNKDFFRMLLQHDRDRSFIIKIRDIVTTQYFEKWKSLYMPENDEYSDFYYSYMLTGIAGIIEVWLRNNMEQSAEEIASLTEDIIFHGFESLNPVEFPSDPSSSK